MNAARQRLILLYVLATGPLLLILAVGAWVDRATALRTAERQADTIARIGAAQQDDLLEEAQNLLSVLGLAPGLLGSGCRELLRQVDDAHPQMTSLALFGPEGREVCNSRGARAPLDVADRTYFQRAVSGDGAQPVAGEIVTSRVTGLPTIVVASAVRDKATGALRGVLAATINLGWFNALAERLSETPGTVVGVIDLGSGQGIMRGSNVVEPGLLAALRASPGGGRVEALLNGSEHRVAFAPLRGLLQPTALLVGLPNTQVLAQSNTHLTLDMVGFAGAAVAAVLLAWLAAETSLLRPIRRLAATAGSIGHDGAAAVAGRLPGAVRELQMLAGSFDEMAERLRLRDVRIASMQASLAASEEHHRLLAESVTDMIARFDRGFVRTYISPACREVLGYEPAEMVGLIFADVVLDADRGRVATELLRPLQHGAATARATYRVTRRDGAVIWLETVGRRLVGDAGFVTVARDVSVQKALETELEAANQQLRIQVMQDPLTGIANRRRFEEMLGYEFRRSRRLGEPLSVLLADIDHFKSFNDRYGHGVGDECLRGVAVALDRALRRPGDLAGRYGGEEFAILLPGTNGIGALVVAERVRAAVAAVRLGGKGALCEGLTVSVGVATVAASRAMDGPAGLVEAADAALYKAKREGRDRVRATVLDGVVAERECGET